MRLVLASGGYTRGVQGGRGLQGYLAHKKTPNQKTLNKISHKAVAWIREEGSEINVKESFSGRDSAHKIIIYYTI